MINNRKTKYSYSIIASDFNNYRVMIDKSSYEFEEILEESKSSTAIQRRNFLVSNRGDIKCHQSRRSSNKY